VYSRRTALIRIATAATSAAVAPLLADSLEGEHHLHELLEQTPAPTATEPVYFSGGDFNIVSKLVDLIIPRTETPGAVDAGVPHWIEREVAAKAELQEQFKQGLAYLADQAKTLNAAGFSALSEAQQITTLQAMSGAQGEFFKTLKDLTVDTYYRTEAGLAQELGFKGNTFRASFPGCTHPEHWPTNAANQEHSQ
jgi:hypothetical protein